MDHNEFIDKLSYNPVVAAAKSDEGLERSFETESEVVFILYGDITNIPEIVRRVKDHGKAAVVHMDLINGLSSKTAAVDYIRQFTEADGIITTKSGMMQYARRLGLNTVLRFFVIDSLALENIRKQSQPGVVQPDVIEILPGIILPSVIRDINSITRVPVMAGGLIRTKEEVMSALDGGALAVSTTNEKVWFV